MSAESPRHGRAGTGGPLTVASQPPSDRSLIDTVSGFLNDVSLSGAAVLDSRDTIQWAHFETADVNEPVPEGENNTDTAPLLLVLGYGSGVQVWLIPPNGEAQEVLSWRQGSVRALRILPTPSAGDSFASERPLLALCDSAGPQPLFCSLSFISLRRGEQVKSIKFKNPILEVLANKRSVVVSFSERFAVFDAGTLEDRLSVTTCYPCPCPLGGGGPINPLALGDRWLAYADKKLNATKRSSGGCEGEGVTSYTATVLHAAKSLSKGLRGLGESVASSLAGGRTLSQSPSPPNADHQQPGVVTILDIEGSSEGDSQEPEGMWDATVAHFVAHSDALIALAFDASGMLLVTADKRGHDFHVFRVQPHPCHPSLAAVHHLYILHRGDTTAKVQDIAISADSRWAAVSTLRGTTHVFPVSPYGGPCAVRTHTHPRVVNRLSRFHRSAGLPIHARSSSPVGDGIAQGAWYPNPRLPPYPLPTTVGPLAQLRPMPAAAGLPTHTITRNSSGRQRLSSLSEDAGGVPLLARACWGAAIATPPAAQARSPAAHSLYVMAATGHLLHYLIHPRHAAGVAKEKVCEDTPVELGVELVAQWPLSRPPAAPDAAAPLPSNNPLLHRQHYKSSVEASASEEERWLAQVEIVTHAGPHRRLWMGPQFVFKTYNATLSGSSSSLLEAEAVEVEAAGVGAARSPPVNMPGARPLVPVLIDSGSASSLEHSPSDSFRRKSFLLEAGSKPVGDKALGDVQLREDLAEAMRETEQGGCRGSGAELARRVASVARAVDPQGTVVAPGEDTELPEDNDDPDLYTQANTDEALFRPVVRAPAALPSPSDLNASHLPAGTTIPVQSLLRTALPPSPDEESIPLNSEVIIPAALTCHTDESTIVREKDFENYTKQPSIQIDLDMPVDPVESIQSQQDIPEGILVAKEIEQLKLSELCAHKKKELDVFVESAIADSKVERAVNKQENVTEKVTKISHKAKGRDRRSITPLKSIETFKSEAKTESPNVADIESKGQLELLQKSEEIYTDSTFCNPKSSLRKSNKKNSSNEEKVEEHANIKQDDSANEQSVEFTVRLPTSAEEAREFTDPSIMCKEPTKTSSALEIDGENEKVVSVKDTSCNKTEDQIWAMLSENSNDTIERTLRQTKKTVEDIKTKPRKSKKNRTRLPSGDANILKDVASANPTINIEASSNLHVQDTACSFSQIEEITGALVTEQKQKEFIKAKSLSPETSANVKQIKDATNFKQSRSIHDEDLQCITEIPTVGSLGSKHWQEKCSKFVSIEYGESKKPAVSAKDSLEGFDVPIDFDSYFISKDIALEGESVVSKINKETSSQEMVSDSVFSLQTNKLKKPNRKDHLKYTDFVTIEQLETKRVDRVSENKKYNSHVDSGKELILTLENKATTMNIDNEPKIHVMNSAKEDFPTIGSLRGTRSHKKRSLLNQVPPDQSIPPIKSYSSIAAFSSKSKDLKPEDFLGLELSKTILEPPKPCRSSLHEKLAELCKITDIAVAECDAPDEVNYEDEDPSSVFELPPFEFSLDEFKLEVMRDSLLDAEEKKCSSPICSINVDDILFNIKDITDTKITSGKLENAATISDVVQDLSVIAFKSECESKSDTKGEATPRDIMEKSSDDDNTSPASSQTESDEREEKKIAASSSLALPTQKSSSKKKPRQKKRK